MNDAIDQATKALWAAWGAAKKNPGNNKLAVEWKTRSDEYVQMIAALKDDEVNIISSSSHAEAVSRKGRESVMLLKPNTWRSIGLGTAIVILGAIGTAVIMGGFRVYVRVSGLTTQVAGLSSQERSTDETLRDHSERITQVSRQVTVASESNLKQFGFLEEVSKQNKDELKSDVAKAQLTLGTQIAGVQKESEDIKGQVTATPGRFSDSNPGPPWADIMK